MVIFSQAVQVTVYCGHAIAGGSVQEGVCDGGGSA